MTGDPWWRVLLVEVFAWVGSATAADFTRNPGLLPGVFIIGSFLVPLALLVWLLERSTRQWLAGGHQDLIAPRRLLLAFAAGGVLGSGPRLWLNTCWWMLFPPATSSASQPPKRPSN